VYLQHSLILRVLNLTYSVSHTVFLFSSWCRYSKFFFGYEITQNVITPHSQSV